VRLVPARGKLTRLAVLASYRKYGLGRVLVRALEEHVAAHPKEMKYVRVEGGRTLVNVKIHSQVSWAAVEGRGEAWEEPRWILRRVKRVKWVWRPKTQGPSSRG
jgi:GNAT superfamily N-acetyltransferase